MCYWCDPSAEMPVHPSREVHDLWLFPHGRTGYTPQEKIAEAIADCPWCRPLSLHARRWEDYIDEAGYG